MQEANLVFIVGVGRSGTTLLQSMLNAHPDICFSQEIGFIRKYLAGRILERAYEKRGADGVVEVLNRDERISRLNLTEKEIREVVSACESPFSTDRLYVGLLIACSRKKGSHRWLGDKDPRLIEYLPMLKKSFPGAVVIHIIRDPRDVLASKKKAAWSRGRSVLYHIFANRVQFKLARKLGPETFGKNYHEVHYRKLLQDPEKELKAICDLLNLEFDPCMLSFGESSKEIVASDEIEWKKETFGPLLRGNTGKWLRQLTDWEIDLTEKVCKSALVTLGYGLQFRKSRVGLLGGLCLRFVGLGIRTLDPCYRFYRTVRQ